MNFELARINLRVSKIQNESSKFCQNEEFCKLQIQLVDKDIDNLRKQHINQELPDLSALEASWLQFKSNISDMSPLEDIKSKIVSLAKILTASAGAPAAGEEDPYVQEAIDADEEEKAQRLKAQKTRLPKDKPNLFKAIHSLARNIVDEEYGEEIKKACLEKHPSIVYKDAFLKLLLIEKSKNEWAAHTQHEMEWNLSEEAFEEFNKLQEDIKSIPPQEKISLLQKMSSPKEEKLTENEKKLSDTLNKAIKFLKITKDEELIYPQLLCENVENLVTVSDAYEKALKNINTLESPKKEKLLAKTIFELRSADPELFFYAMDQALKNSLTRHNQKAIKAIQHEINCIISILDKELETDPRIMKSFSKGSILWKYFHNRMMDNEYLILNAMEARFSMLMIPTLFEEECEFALKLREKISDFLKGSEEKFTVPFEFIQELIKHDPQMALPFVPYLSLQERAQYFVQQIYAAKESGQEGEIPNLLYKCKIAAGSFMEKILVDYLDECARQPSKESADSAKIKIRQFLAYFRSELKEFLPDQSYEEIEFDLLLGCLEKPNNLLHTLLIPELVRLGKKETALEISRAFLSVSANCKALSYALLKASGLNWRSLDEVTLGPLVESENADAHPLDKDFTGLYLEFMRSLPNLELYIGDVIDLSRSLDSLVGEFRNESYREFSLQVTELLEEILPKAFNRIDSEEDSIRTVKTLSGLVVGFSLVNQTDRLIPMATSALEKIPLINPSEDQCLLLLNMLASHLITSIKIIHKKSKSDASQIPLKEALVNLVFETISKMPNFKNRIEALFDIPYHLESHENDDFYVGFSLSAMNQTLKEIRNWNAIGECIQEKIDMLEDLFEMANEMADPLFEELSELIILEAELTELETKDDMDPTLKVESCIKLIRPGQDSGTRGRILIIYEASIVKVSSSIQDKLKRAMETALLNSDRTSPEDEG